MHVRRFESENTEPRYLRLGVVTLRTMLQHFAAIAGNGMRCTSPRLGER